MAGDTDLLGPYLETQERPAGFRVRVVAVHATHGVFQNRVMKRLSETGHDIQMAAGAKRILLRFQESKGWLFSMYAVTGDASYPITAVSRLNKMGEFVLRAMTAEAAEKAPGGRLRVKAESEIPTSVDVFASRGVTVFTLRLAVSASKKD